MMTLSRLNLPRFHFGLRRSRFGWLSARVLFISLIALILASCDRKTDSSAASPQKDDNLSAVASTPKSAGKQEKIQYPEIEWTDLIPKEDLEALMNPPEYLEEIEDGSEEDNLNDQLRVEAENPDDPYQRALVSTRVIEEFNQRKVRIPGFIVPLDFNDQNIITSFLLVPFFGACIHVPPPPPNQIIYATYEPGIALDDLSDAFYIDGTLFTELKESELATSAYSITVDQITPYYEDE